jgi:hypothetical protein
MAFMTALVRLTEDNALPVGCALLVHDIETANRAHHELPTLLPGRVAVFTSEHDADRAVAVREHRYSIDELDDQPAIIVISMAAAPI